MTPQPPVPDPAGSPTEPLPPFDSAENPTRPLPRPNGFFTWLRSLGIVRGEDRWVGGVCEGIATRTGLDPVLVRGLFIVLGLFGGGLLLYGLAWALFPEPDGRIHAEEALRGSWTSGTTGALTATILGTGPSIWWAGDGLFGGLFWTLFSIAGVGLIIYWLVTRSGGGAARGTSSASSTPSMPPTSPAPYAAASTPGTAPYTAQRDTMQMPAGSSVRPAAVPPRRRTTPGAAETAVVLGAVLLTIGVILTLDYASVIDIETPVAVALAAGAAVNGLGIVILGTLGRSSGILGLTAIAAVAGAGVAGSNLGTFDTVVVANQGNWTPTASSPATGGYTLAAADGNLDLRYLADETDPAVEIPVNVAASDLTILVPDDVPVLVRADMFAGNVQIDDGVTLTESGGLWKTADERMNDTDGDPLVVRIKGVASNVLVTVNESDLDR
ncbi:MULTISPECIES: PspC domain-containing protein [unclassified Arthrobacter]|uniref:PspC domain-containing protein n=1 Tax=unclassified Arthrobacter TaxID=235627 RepID=UPI0015E232FB|nr:MULTISPECIES: PspC domain-containing protein [unclassified Arthrobacter]